MLGNDIAAAIQTSFLLFHSFHPTVRKFSRQRDSQFLKALVLVWRIPKLAYQAKFWILRGTFRDQSYSRIIFSFETLSKVIIGMETEKNSNWNPPSCWLEKQRNSKIGKTGRFWPWLTLWYRRSSVEWQNKAFKRHLIPGPKCQYVLPSFFFFFFFPLSYNCFLIVKCTC